MFDVGFSEIVLILVVALVVIGPEKLPKVARTLGLLTGRVQRYAASVKADVERELILDTLDHCLCLRPLQRPDRSATPWDHPVRAGIFHESHACPK